MTRRFKRHEWHPVRLRMDEMSVGDKFELPAADSVIAQQSKHRLKDAYLGERLWAVSKKGDVVSVERIK